MRLQAVVTSWGGSRWVRVPQHRASPQGWQAFRRSSRPSLAAASVGGGPKQPAMPQKPDSPQPLPQVQQPPCNAWEQACQQVAAFQQQHGWLPRASTDAHGRLLPGERPLGVWCTEQQRRKAGSKGPPLTAQEQAALLAIPGWSWWATKRLNKPWEQRRQEVEDFYQQQGWLPRQSTGRASPFLPGERELGTWVNRQRQCYKSKKQPLLSAERIAALEATPGWAWEEWSLQPWEQRRQEVEAFYQQYGRIPRHKGGKTSPFLHGERELGTWVNRQRQCHKSDKQSSLSAEPITALEATPGWYWDVEEEKWEQQRQKLEAFVLMHGRLPRSQPGSSDSVLPFEKELGSWMERQRQSYKRQKLSAEQIAALEETPGWCWAERFHQPWEQRLQHVLAFVHQHGRIPRALGGKRVPLQPHERELGTWCIVQRRRLKGCSHQPPLMTEQQAALAAVPGWFWDADDLWEQQRQQLEAFERKGMMQWLFLACYGVLGDERVTALSRYARLAALRDLRCHTDGTLLMLEDMIPRVLEGLMEAFPDHSWRCPKLHHWLFHPTDIRNWGMTDNVSTQPREGTNPEMRAAYDFTNKQAAGLPKQRAAARSSRRAVVSSGAVFVFNTDLLLADAAGGDNDSSLSEQLAYIVSELESVSQLPSLITEYYTNSYHDGHLLSDDYAARKEVQIRSFAALPRADDVVSMVDAVLTLQFKARERGGSTLDRHVLLVQWLEPPLEDEALGPWDPVLELRRFRWQYGRRELGRNRRSRELFSYQLIDLATVTRQVAMVAAGKLKDGHGNTMFVVNDIADFEHAMQELAYVHTPGSFGAKAEQLEALEAIRLPGRVSGAKDRWEQQRQKLEAFVRQHGRMPRARPTRKEPLLEGEQVLGAWRERQRQRQKGRGSWSALTAEELAALEAIGPPGRVSGAGDRWERQRQRVKAFVRQHGRLPRTLPNRKEPLLEGERQLGIWCSTQSQRQKGHGSWSALTPEQLAALEAIPFWCSRGTP
ncbi:hypothetical protein N2152v2_009725 [Parachlorella kessleri]